MRQPNKAGWAWISIAVLLLIISCSSVEGRARGAPAEDEDYMDLDYTEVDRLKKKNGISNQVKKPVNNAGGMQMLLRQQPSVEPDRAYAAPQKNTTSQSTFPVDNYTTTKQIYDDSFEEDFHDSEESRQFQGDEEKEEPTPRTCNVAGMPRFPFKGKNNAERMLLKAGNISQIPTSRCGNQGAKNVFLVVGDGMGWEMTRAGAVAKQVIQELEELGCNITTGCPNNTLAMDGFRGRTLDDYYTEGRKKDRDGNALCCTSYG